MQNKRYDIYIVGVGGQGVLTIAEIITSVAFEEGIPVNYYPTKGMAQRGGFVKAQLRLGAETVGPDIAQQGADLVISMERSEALKAIRYMKKGGEFFLYDNKWLPTAVMLGKAPYPETGDVRREIAQAGGKAKVLSSEALPEFEGKPVRDNLYVLGAILKSTSLEKYLERKAILRTIESKWPKAAEENLYAVEQGLKADMT